MCVCVTGSEAVLSVLLLALFRLKRPNQFDFNASSVKQFVYFSLSAMTSSSQLPYIVPLEMVCQSWDCIFSAYQMMEWSRRGKSWSVWKDSRLSSWVVIMKLRPFFWLLLHLCVCTIILTLRNTSDLSKAYRIWTFLPFSLSNQQNFQIMYFCSCTQRPVHISGSEMWNSICKNHEMFGLVSLCGRIGIVAGQSHRLHCPLGALVDTHGFAPRARCFLFRLG